MGHPSDRAVFTTEEVGRVFVVCQACRRLIPHYAMYGEMSTKRAALCRCGHSYFIPARISEVRAAWWVLVVGWFWRKTIRKERFWDPRMPVRTELNT